MYKIRVFSPNHRAECARCPGEYCRGIVCMRFRCIAIPQTVNKTDSACTTYRNVKCRLVLLFAPEFSAVRCVHSTNGIVFNNNTILFHKILLLFLRKINRLNGINVREEPHESHRDKSIQRISAHAISVSLTLVPWKWFTLLGTLNTHSGRKQIVRINHIRGNTISE